MLLETYFFFRYFFSFSFIVCLSAFLSLCLVFLLLFHLQEKCSVDTRQDTSKGDGRADKVIQFFITADGKLEVARGNALHLEILGSVASEFEDFGSQVFQYSSDIYGS